MKKIRWQSKRMSVFGHFKTDKCVVEAINFVYIKVGGVHYLLPNDDHSPMELWKNRSLKFKLNSNWNGKVSEVDDVHHCLMCIKTHIYCASQMSTNLGMRIKWGMARKLRRYTRSDLLKWFSWTNARQSLHELNKYLENSLSVS